MVTLSRFLLSLPVLPLLLGLCCLPLLGGCGLPVAHSPAAPQLVFATPPSPEGFEARMRLLQDTPEEQFMPRFAAVMQSDLGPDLDNAEFPGNGRKIAEYTWRTPQPCSIRVVACNGLVQSYSYTGPGCVRPLPDKILPEPAVLPPVVAVRGGRCP